MNSRVQGKINEIKKLSVRSKATLSIPSSVKNQNADGLSMAIHCKRDAETFMTELNAIRKRAK